MSFTLTPYQYLLFSAAALCLLLILYLQARKQFRGVGALSFVLVSAILWSLGAALETGIGSIPAKIVLYKISQTGSTWMQFTWFVFVLQFTRKKKWGKPDGLAFFAFFPLLFTLIAWTNEYHQLFWKALFSGPESLAQSPANALGIVGLADYYYASGLVLYSALRLLRKMIGARGQQLEQASILLACTIAPWAANTIDTFSLTRIHSLELFPFIFNLNIFLFIIGLLRYRLLNIVPIGYQSMVDGMRDGILVLSLENRVVHLNPTAESILGQPLRALVGQPIEQALARHPELLRLCCENKVESILEEVILQTGESSPYYELHLSTLKDRYGYAIGRLVTLRNITKRVQAENASRYNQLLLKQSEEKYRSLVENINEVIFTADSEGVFTYISPVVERLTGFAPEDFAGKTFRDFVYPDDLEIMERGVQSALTSQIQMLEFRILDRNKNIRFLRAYSRPIQHEGRVIGLQGVISDVTERRNVDAALERRASQLALLNFIGEQIAAAIELKDVLDNATHLIRKHFGYYHVAIFTPNYERGELLMRSTSGAFSELFPEGHHLKFGQGIVGWAALNKTTLLANDVRIEPRYTNLYPDKIMTRAELAAPILAGDKLAGILDVQSPQVNAFDDNDVRVMETIADQIAIAMENARLYEELRRRLKDREHQENMLRIQRDLLVRLSSAKNLEETFQLAVESLSSELRASRVAILLVDWEKQVIRPVVSLGYPLNRPILPAPLDRSFAGRVARTAQPMLIPNVNTSQSELEVSPGTLTLLCVPLISNGRVIGVISLDSGQANAFSHDDMRLVTILANSLVMLIERARLFEEVEGARTELEKRATELEEANASLREMDHLKSQFLANVSHELRTPLNSIIGFSEVLVDELPGALNDEQKEYIQDILESGRHLLKLINDVLDFSKIESGYMALELSTFEVRALFEELRITIAPLVEKKSQVLVFRQDGALPPITADHLRIKQVFINLLSNANKFTPERGMITAACRLVAPNQMLFSVSDTGIGIRPEDQEMIFEEFRQVDGSLTREVPGTGLGLAISRRIVEMHNGRVWVESDLGQGATFFVSLPVNCPPD